MKLFLLKNAKFSSAGGPQTAVPPATWGFAPRPLHCKFLATRLAEMVPVSDQYWFGLCFSKYFTLGNILGWTNLLEYRSLAKPDKATGIRSVYWYLRSAQSDNYSVSADNLLQVPVL